MAGERKTAFIREVLRRAQELGAVADDVADLENEYFDNGYDGAGGNSIVDANVAAYDITAAEFNSLITVMQQLDKLMTNQATTLGDYIANLNAVKRAPV